MGMRPTPLVAGEYYHIYNRGNNKQEIFFDDADYRKFQLLLYLMNNSEQLKLENVLRKGDNPYQHKRKEPLVYIGAYCLMPNHFHILVKPMADNTLSKFMKKLCTSYSMHVNNKYERTGSLFEGKFKASWVDSDRYLRHLYAYIHLNPAKIVNRDWKTKGVGSREIEFVSRYQYSSHTDYTHEKSRVENAILSPNQYPEYFLQPGSAHSIYSWLENPQVSTTRRQERPSS